MTTRRPWTDNEMEAVRTRYGSDRGAVFKLAAELRRTVNSIRHIAKRFGYVGPQEPYWSDSEDAYLREQYADTAISVLCAHLGRTRNAVVTRANGLGIKKSPDGTYAEQAATLGLGCANASLLTETEAAYIAGIFDGEGCVSLWLRRKRTVAVSVMITNTDANLINWLHEKLGGNVWTRTRTGKYKTVYRWDVRGGRSAIEFLSRIRPYLIVKAKQADIAMRWKPGMKPCDSKTMVNLVQSLNIRGNGTRELS